MKPAFVWRAIDLLSRGIHPWRFQVGPENIQGEQWKTRWIFLGGNFLYKAYEFSSKSDEKILDACSACYSQIQAIPILRISKWKIVQECGALALNSYAQKKP